MGKFLSAIVWGIIGAVVLAVAFGALSLSLPALTKDPSAAAATAVLVLMGALIGLVAGGIFGIRRAG